MAPTVGFDAAGRVVAVGSPGADRITTALAQVVSSFAHGAYGLQAAVDRPRMHVRRAVDGSEVLEYEEDLHVPDLPRGVDLPRHPHHPESMYFGGVGAAVGGPGGHLDAAADPRRSGAVAFG